MPLTTFQTIAKAVNEQLAGILTSEDRPTPDFVYRRQDFAENDKDFRVWWSQPHGSYVSKPDPPKETAPLPADGIAPPVATIILRRAMAYIRIAAPDQNTCEHVGDRLVLAAERSPYCGNFTWTLATYQYPTEMVDQPQMRNGVEILVVMVPIDLPVPAQYDGERSVVTIDDTQLRAGNEDELDTTTPGQPEFQLSEWT